MMTYDCADAPGNDFLKHHPACDCHKCLDFEKEITRKTFEMVMEAPATAEEKSIWALATEVVTHKNSMLILKSIVYQMLHHSGQEFEDTLNQAVTNHPTVDPEMTICLDIYNRV